MEKLVTGREGAGTEDTPRFERLYNIARDCADSRMDTACFKCWLSITVKLSDTLQMLHGCSEEPM